MAAALLGIDELVSVGEDGLARLTGRRISVPWIASLWSEGLTAEEIVDEVFAGTVTLAQVHAALAFYYRNRDAIEADQAARDAEYDRRAGAAAPLAALP
jgi:uncharacterized protein (DUF433 family)